MYRVDNAVQSFSMGLMQETMHILFVNYLLYVPYIYVWEHYAVYRLPNTWATWIAVCFGT